MSKLKDYLNYVVTRTTDKLASQSFGAQEQVKFWEAGIKLATKLTAPDFKEISEWLDMLFKAPVHAVYKLDLDMDLSLQTKHIVPENIQNLLNTDDPYIKSLSRKERFILVGNLEDQLNRLERNREWDENLLNPGYTVFTIGRCFHFPLYNEDQLWGIYVAGPYIQVPDSFMEKLPVVSGLLSKWMIVHETTSVNRRDFYEKSASSKFNILGNMILDTEGIFTFLLNYIQNVTKTSFVLLAELRNDKVEPIASVGLTDEWMNIFTGTIEDSPFEFDEEQGTVYEKDTDIILKSGIISHFLFPVTYEGGLGFLLIGTSRDDHFVPNLAIIILNELCFILGQIMFAERLNQDRVNHLQNIYYAMVRLHEMRKSSTVHHTPRVMALTERVLQKMDIEEEVKKHIRLAAKFHDLGYGAATEMKEDLTIDEEIEHPVLGKMLLNSVPVADEVKNGILWHEEWYNGQGYPDGISGNAIPLEAQVVGIVEHVVEFVESHVGQDSGAPDHYHEELIKDLNGRMEKQFSAEMVKLMVSVLEHMTWNDLVLEGVE